MSAKKSVKVDRREFLRLSAFSAAGLTLAACRPAAPPAPEVVEEAPPPTPVPEAKAPAATPTPIPTREATATPVPTLEAEVKEAPMLAQMVAEGKLPPLADRLPKNPLVLAPIHEIGEYGGTLRTLTPSVWAGHWQESMYGHSALRWIDDGLGIAPGTCDWWEPNADNTEWTIHFREGLKWSDGEPCTVDDVLFWWNDMVLNPEHPDNPPDFGSAGGELVQFTKVDDFTLKLTYVEPAPLTAKRLAMWVNAEIGPRWIVPSHWLKQFHPDYSDYTDMDEITQRQVWRNYPGSPVLTAWMVEEYEPAVGRTWVRNPYYYAVDTQGNQLPYIDYVDEQVIEDREVQILNIMQGTLDWVHFHGATLADVGTLKANEDRGNYEVRFWDSGSGTGQMYFWNFDHPDEKKREILRNPKFKKAMSHAMDRPTIQRIVYYNTGMITTGSMSPKAIEFNFNEQAREMYRRCRDAHVDYDPELAKQLLDEIGMVDVDGDGFREFPDGSKFELRFDLQADAGRECLDVLEITHQNWKDVGLNVIINHMPPAEFGIQWQGGKGEFRGNWEVGDGPDHLVYPSWVVPNEPARWAPLCGNRLMLVGTEKEDTELDKSPWDRSPPRWASTEPELRESPVWELQELYEVAKLEVDELKRHEMVWQMLEIHIANIFYLGTVANYPRIIFLSRDLVNVPTKDELATGGFVNPWIIPFPAVTNTELYAFKR